MRATCARVLAAALLTGAIATVVWMSALVGTPNEAGRPIAAPPSSQQRTVRLTAQGPPRRHAAERLVTHNTIPAVTRPAAAASSLAVVVDKRRPRRQAPGRELATRATPAVSEPVPDTGRAPEVEQLRHGRGHAHGRD